MRSHHLCFVGYSGRDIDFFPYIEAATRTDKVQPPIWVNRNFQDDPADGPSQRCRARRLTGQYPSELLENLLSHNKAALSKDKQPRCSGIGTLKHCALQLRNELRLPAHIQRLLHIQLMSRLGNYREAHKMLESDPKILGDPALGLGCLLAGRLSHEVARYKACEDYARRVIVGCRLSIRPRWQDLLLQGLCLFSEARRMQIPYDTYFEVRGDARILKSVVLIVLFTVVAQVGTLLSYLLRNENKLSTGTQHELLEHRVRLLSILQAAFWAMPTILGWWGLDWLTSRWQTLSAQCKRQGYASGIANCHKFATRLSQQEQADAGQDIYRLLTDSSGLELSLRNEANECIKASKWCEARSRFKKMAALAKKSGNQFNEIKALLGQAFVNQRVGKSTLLDSFELERFDDLVAQLDAPSLIEHLRKIRARYLSARAHI